MKKLLLALVALSFAGCGQPTQPKWENTPTVTKIDNVVRVFMNRPNDYTIFVQQENKLVPRYVSIYSYEHLKWSKIEVFTDVPADKPMYVEKRAYPCLNYDDVPHSGCDAVPKERYEYDIHIRVPQDISGGQWSEQVKSGKTTKTETGKVIEIK